MSTEWVVTTAAERVALDDAKQGETTFTVTNSSPRADRAMFEVVPGDGADASWFTVEEPQRLVKPAGSVSYLMRVAVPTGTRPGRYAVQGRVYSADAPPEEASVLSGRLAVEVKPEPQPVKQRVPWWIWIVVGVLSVALVVAVSVAVFGGDDEPTVTPAPRPTPSATPSAVPSASGPAEPGDTYVPVRLVQVPEVTGLSRADATAKLAQAGLEVGTVVRQFDEGKGGVVSTQVIGAGSTLSEGSKVDLVVSATRTAPTFTTGGVALRPGLPIPPVVWTRSDDSVGRWNVHVDVEVCYMATRDCAKLSLSDNIVTEPTFAPPLSWDKRYLYATVQVTVTPLDDEGAVGPSVLATHRGPV